MYLRKRNTMTRTKNSVLKRNFRMENVCGSSMGTLKVIILSPIPELGVLRPGLGF